MGNRLKRSLAKGGYDRWSLSILLSHLCQPRKLQGPKGLKRRTEDPAVSLDPAGILPAPQSLLGGLPACQPGSFSHEGLRADLQL